MLLLISALLLTCIFFIAGISKIKAIKENSNGLAEKPFFRLMHRNIITSIIWLVVVIEIVCPILIIYGLLNPSYKNIASISTLILIVFSIIATMVYHYPPKKLEYYFFIKNVAIIGGLISFYLHLAP